MLKYHHDIPGASEGIHMNNHHILGDRPFRMFPRQREI